MATYYSSADGRGYRLRLEISQSSQSIPNNTSTVPYALYLENVWYTFSNYNSTGSLVIDGSTVWSLAANYSSPTAYNSEKLLTSGTRTISHASNGTKTLSFSASFKTNVSGSYGTTTTLTISNSMALTTIPREGYLNSMNNFTIGNSTSISYYSYSTSFNYKFHLYVGSTYLQEFTSSGVSGTKSLTITPSSDSQRKILNAIGTGGTTASMNIYMSTWSGSTQIGGWTAAKTATASTAASTISSFGNFTITDTYTGTASVSRSNSLLTHDYVISVGGTNIFSTSGSGSTTYRGTLDNTIRGTILSKFSAGGTSVTVTVSVTTKAPDGGRIGAVQTRNATASISASSISGFSNFTITSSSMGAITISRATSLLRHIYKVKAGSTVIADSGYNTNTTYTGSLDNTKRSAILNLFGTGATSATVTAEVTTYYGTIRIGSTVTRNATASISASSFTSTLGNFDLNGVEPLATINRNFAVSEISTLLSKTVNISIGSFSKSATTTGTSAPISLTEANQNTIYNVLKNAMSGTMTETLTTYYNGTRIGSVVSRTVTVSIPNVSLIYPQINSVTFTPTSAAYTTLGVYVQGYARPKITVSAAGNKYATISSYSITFNGLTTSTNGYTFPVVSGSGTFTANVTVTDSRGKTATSNNVSINVAEYSPPTINTFSANRAIGAVTNPLGTDLRLNVDVSAVAAGSNNLRVIVRKKERALGTWLDISDVLDTTSPLSVSYILTDDVNIYDATKSYDVEIEVSDKLHTQILSTVIATGQVPLAITGIGIGVGGIPQAGRVLDVYGDIYMTGILQSGSVPWARLTDTPAYTTRWPSWSEVTSKPSTFPPSSHTHEYSSLTGIPSTFPPSSHTHSYLPLSGGSLSGTLNLTYGGGTSKLNMGSYYSGTSSSTGVIRITLGTENVMLNMRITLRSYNYMAVIYVGGYTYTSTTAWHIPQAFGFVDGGTLNVRHSASGTTRYIQIGDTNTAWSGYLNVTVERANNGYGTLPNNVSIGVYTSYAGTTNKTTTIGYPWTTANLSQAAQSNWGSAPSSPRPGDMYFT